MPEAHPQPCPYCGAPIRVESTTREDVPNGPEALELSTGERHEKDIDLPPTILLAPGSHDDDFFSSTFGGKLAASEPDPILGEFVSSSSGTSTSAVLEGRPRPASGESFPSLNLGSRTEGASARTTAGPEPYREDQEEGGDFEPEPRRTSWASILLASYASAMTLGLAWMVMKERSRENSDAGSKTPPAAAAPESARQTGLSRKVEPPEPIVGDHFATMGKPLRVGDLEVTPLDLKRQDVMLQRSASFAGANRKLGGKGALVLRLRLKNTSADAAFSPLDQAYLRERGKEIVDTFIQTPAGDRIYPFPLAVDSEWSIVGQDFDALRPGESKVVAIVSTPDAPPPDAGPLTWRVRLRTGINRNDLFGLRWPAQGGGRP